MLLHIIQWRHGLGMILCIHPPVRYFGVGPGVTCYSVACCAGNALCAYEMFFRP